MQLTWLSVSNTVSNMNNMTYVTLSGNVNLSAYRFVIFRLNLLCFAQEYFKL